ncbi:hypothetical protein BO86DRAFT_325971 [Aspergillus japonicus CBS 114.51]|uniref:Uncharacterized protein n=1 Tax=Aspergillus japonicus CBS 114.51 TaxID=1448312 RepID=A0A8T8WKG6_ASPJA|nr:hypothetical protein BO86DRAFT_325971 [Aspergillus japonicus CBS 114.51]RAH76325.1 hypothetical protein BO86DRAFT_325971 [Aspergillus japonicus CBS 114.51]
MRVSSAAVVASLAAGAIATEYKTVVVTEYATYCPQATSLAAGPGTASQGNPSAAQPTTVTISGTAYTYSTPLVTSTVTHCDKWYVSLGSLQRGTK